jgi:hypothetical protein
VSSSFLLLQAGVFGAIFKTSPVEFTCLTRNLSEYRKTLHLWSRKVKNFKTRLVKVGVVVPKVFWPMVSELGI